MLTLLLLASILPAVVVYWQLRRWQLQSKTANIPSMPGELPLVGHLLTLLNVELWDNIQRAAKTTNAHGGITKFWFGPALYFVVTDSTIAKELSNVVLEKSFMYKFGASLVGQGLVTSNATTWRRHRKLLNPTFSQQMLNRFLNLFNKESENLVESLAGKVGKGEFDVFHHINRYASDTICQTALGISEEQRSPGFVKQYGDLVDQVLKLMTMRFRHMWMALDCLYYWTRTKAEEDCIVKQMVSMADNVIEDKKSSFQKEYTDDRFKSFLDVLLEQEADGSLTQQEVREEVNTIIMGGSDTISRSLVYVLVILGSFPEVQNKLYDEIKGIFKDTDRDVTKEDLPQLVYTEAVIKEVLRLYPIVPIFARLLKHKDVQVGKYYFPKGSNIFVNILGMHTASSWGDPQVFRPERWLEHGTSLEDSYALFGVGRRSCIGKGYAMMSMKTALTHLMRRYAVRSNHTRLQSRWDILLKPTAGSEISIELRS